jgi:hypothetical protein
LSHRKNYNLVVGDRYCGRPIGGFASDLGGGFACGFCGSVKAVPEPNEWLLMLFGLGVVGFSQVFRRFLVQVYNTLNCSARKFIYSLKGIS